MQVILDSSFARPGSAPIWGGKKGEFRDWTTRALISQKPIAYCIAKINKLKSGFHASVLLLIMNFVITLSK